MCTHMRSYWPVRRSLLSLTLKQTLSLLSKIVCSVFFEARVVAHTLQEVEMHTANGALMDF